MFTSIVTAILSALLSIAPTQADLDDEFQKGATSGAHDLCQEVGGTWKDGSWCDIPEAKPKVVTKVVYREAPAQTWHGFRVGEVLVCANGEVETDEYEAGQDPAMPHGGTWAHCD